MLGTVDAAAYERLGVRVADLASSLASVLAAGLDGTGYGAQVPVVGTLFGIFFVNAGAPPVSDYDGAADAAGTGLYADFFSAMLAEGVALAPGPYEVSFASMAHDAADVDATLAAAERAVAAVAAGVP